MNTFIIATFADMENALSAAEILRKLHAELRVYAAAAISRSAPGELSRIEVIKRGHATTTVGALIGGLAASPFGPFAVLIGATAGALIGYSAELLHEEDAAKVIRRASRRLNRGEAAVVAEIGEQGSTELVARMEQIGGAVFRE